MGGQNVKGLNLLFFQKMVIDVMVISLKEIENKC